MLKTIAGSAVIEPTSGVTPGGEDLMEKSTVGNPQHDGEDGDELSELPEMSTCTFSHSSSVEQGLKAPTQNHSKSEFSTSVSDISSEDVEKRALRWRTVFLGKNRTLKVEIRYDPREILGAGAYGVVCRAYDHVKKTFCAIKKIEGPLNHRSLAKRTLREMIFLWWFSHENIINLQRIMRPPTFKFRDLYLVMDVMETDLSCIIRSSQPLTDDHVQFFIYQVLRGVKYMHTANVIHRDLKPRNLLVNANCDLKICDLGLARFDDPNSIDKLNMSEYVATRWYRAPEVIVKTNRYTKAIDMWAVGCILGELISRRPLFAGENSVHQIALIKNVIKPNATKDEIKSKLDQELNYPYPKAVDLLAGLLAWDPDQRLTVTEALAHPYLAELHDEKDEPSCLPIPEHWFEFETCNPSKLELRKLMYELVIQNFPEDKYVTDEKPNEVHHFLNPPPKKRNTRRHRRARST